MTGDDEILTYRRPPTSSCASSQIHLKPATLWLGCCIDGAHEDGREPEILEILVQKDFSLGVSCIVLPGSSPKYLLLSGERMGIPTVELWAPNGRGRRWPFTVQGVGASPESTTGEGNQALNLHKITLNVLLCKVLLVGDYLLLLFSYLCWCLVVYLLFKELHVLFLDRHGCCRSAVGVLWLPGRMHTPIDASIPLQSRQQFCHSVSPCSIPHSNCWWWKEKHCRLGTSSLAAVPAAAPATGDATYQEQSAGGAGETVRGFSFFLSFLTCWTQAFFDL